MGLGLLAQVLAQTEPLSGGAGWVGAGLLGAVLFWLLVIHLPSKDKQLKEIIAILTTERGEHTKDLASQRADFLTTMGTLTGNFTSELGRQRADFTGALGQVLKHCEDGVGDMVQTNRDSATHLRESIKDVSGSLTNFTAAIKDYVRAIGPNRG